MLAGAVDEEFCPRDFEEASTSPVCGAFCTDLISGVGGCSCELCGVARASCFGSQHIPYGGHGVNVPFSYISGSPAIGEVSPDAFSAAAIVTARA